jgi:hypothetical protein
MPGHFELFESYIPIDLSRPENFLVAFVFITLVVVFRYFLMVIPFYFAFYIRPSKAAKARQIYPKLPRLNGPCIRPFFLVLWGHGWDLFGKWDGQKFTLFLTPIPFGIYP